MSDTLGTRDVSSVSDVTAVADASSNTAFQAVERAVLLRSVLTNLSVGSGVSAVADAAAASDRKYRRLPVVGATADRAIHSASAHASAG